MNVSQIRDRIIQISHNEDAPDTALKAKALDWLNSAYHELIDELMPLMERQLKQTVSLSVTAGQTLLPADAYRVLLVRGVATGTVYKEQSYTHVKTHSNKAESHLFWLEGQKLIFADDMPASVEVTYLPFIDDLQADGLEADILLPKHLHAGLVWGGLVWSSIFERGLSTQSELALFQQKWEEAKQRIRQSLGAHPAYKRPEQHVDYIRES